MFLLLPVVGLAKVELAPNPGDPKVELAPKAEVLPPKADWLAPKAEVLAPKVGLVVWLAPKPGAGAGKPVAAGLMVPKVPVEAWEERPRVGGPADLGWGGGEGGGEGVPPVEEGVPGLHSTGGHHPWY